MTDQGTSEYFRTKFMQPLVSAMDEKGYNPYDQTLYPYLLVR